jgi:hypothetical protein
LAQGLQWFDITDLIISEGEISQLNQGLQGLDVADFIVTEDEIS